MISFRHPYLLLGIIAAIIPVLIYLFTRDRVSVVPFSTLRFFAGSSVKFVRRKKWLETLLLVLRAGLLALIAFAFARPFLAKKPDASGQTRVDNAVVIAIDVSQSMSRGNAFKDALDKANKAIDSLSAGTAVSVVSFDQAGRVDLDWAEPAAAKAKVDALKPQATGTDLIAGLKKADEQLARVAADKKSVILISDLQKAGWANSQSGWKLAAGVTLDVQPVAAEAGAAIAIIDANLPQTIVNDRLPHPAVVRIANNGVEAIKDATLELALAGQQPITQTLAIPPGQTITSSFRPSFETEGDHAGTITLKAGGVTQQLFLNAHVLPRIAVTILAAEDEATRQGTAPFFLAKAIHPADDSPFDVKIVTPAQATLDELKKSSVLIVGDLPTVSADLKKTLLDFHKSGGGIILMPGSRTQPAGFTEAFGSYAPAQLRRILAASDSRKGTAKAVITRVELDHPILEIFQRPHSGDFSQVAIERYWEVADSQLSRVPLRLDDGRPFMLEKSWPGAGSVVLIASPPDLSWNNMPQRAIFLPVLHQSLRYLAVKAESSTAFGVGELLPLAAGQSLLDPNGQKISTPLVAAAPGLYRVQNAAGKDTFTYAVNTPFAEADTAVVPADELKAAAETPGEAAAGAAGSLSIAKGSRELWSWIIALSLGLVVLELFVSNRVPRH